MHHFAGRHRVSIVFSLVMVVAAVRPVLAGQTCGPGETCTVVGAPCSNDICRLHLPPLLFPSEGALTTIALVQPGDRTAASATPSFNWVYPVGAEQVIVGVFKKPPVFAAPPAAQIANVQDLVWMWRSNLDGDGPGSSSATYVEGGRYEGSSANCERVSAPALANGAYFWAAWGTSGGNLVARSEVRTIFVGEQPLSGTGCFDDEDCGAVAGVRCGDGNYCVLDCASDADCFAGELCVLDQVSSSAPRGFCRPIPICECRGTRTCDADRQICRQEPPPGGSAGCGSCTPSPPVSPVTCAPMLGLALFAAGRRRGGRRRK